MALNLPKIIGGAVALAKKVTQSTLVDVTHLQRTGNDAYGPVLGTTTVRQALWEDAQRLLRMGDGTERLAIGKLTFVEPVVVTPDDRFRLPNMAADSSVPVLRYGALMDPDSQPYLNEVWLGSESTRVR